MVSMQGVKRLIRQFVPENYNLSLTIDREDREFKGTVTIKGQLSPDESSISFHAKELDVKSITLDGKSADFRHSENDELHITQDGLKSGRHIIVIVYSGKITDPMHGLYPCYYEYDGEKKELLATQFESHFAREVFPCIDEPEAKATFDLTLTTETDVTTLSNQPIKKQDTQNNRLVTTFETTPKMSTYLLAFVIGNLHKKSATTKNGVEVNVWATLAQSSHSLDFALDVAKRGIEFYEDYFDTKYPLPKSDHVALPDFTNGAMENWGLITYRETALLANPETTSVSSRQYIATVITHELAHQWFGNLVTMKWWDNLWLNESFATLMEYIATDSLFPDWNIWLDFSTNESISALRRDSIDGVQPVQVDVMHPDEIGTLFDHAIVYAKGARLLRMLQNYVGASDFRAGLKQYFKDHAYGNTVGSDLWDAIAKSSNKDIAGLMSTWIDKPGYPVLHIDKDGQHLNVSQEQFFVGPHEPSDKIWSIPLNATSGIVPKLMTTKSLAVDNPGSDIIYLNKGNTAHFISHYDERTLNNILDDVSNKKIDELSRLQILNESTLLARAGIIPTHKIIDILKAYKNETSEQVWSMIYLSLKELRKFVENDDTAEKKLRALSADIAKSEYGRLGWSPKQDESENDTKLRATVIGLTLYGEDSDAIDMAKKIYYGNKLETLDPELRPLIISSVVRFGDESIVDDLMSRYKSSQSGELKQDIAIGITSTRITSKIKQLLEVMKDTKIVRVQDTLLWYIHLLGGKESHELTWQWLLDNWTWIKATFGSDKSYDDYPRYSASMLSSKKYLHEFSSFFTPMKNDPALKRIIEMGISDIEGRIELIDRDGPELIKRLINL